MAYRALMTSAGATPRLDRRQLLGLLAVGALGLAGCAPSPIITAGAGATPQPAPTLSDARRSAARAAATLADAASAGAAVAGVEAGVAAWLTALAEQYRAHHQVLVQADPLGGVQADHAPLEQIASAGFEAPLDHAQAVGLLAGLCSAHAEDLAGVVAALDADDSPGLALFWISQQVAAQAYSAVLAAGDGAGLGAAPVAGAAVPAELAEPGTPDEARQVLLSHQRALVFGLQTMLGRLNFDDPMVNTVTARLGEAMRERDATAAALTAAGATPEPPAAQYQLPGDAADPAQRDSIWGRLELAVATGWARLAAVDASGRIDATAAMQAQCVRARELGVALPYWPGWV